jgi:1-acyl-sn-glycerol-3-phosphate acyltransferase
VLTRIPDREPGVSLMLYRLFKWSIVSPVLHTYFRGRIHGAEQVPMQGRLLVVSNHASYFDPPIVSNCVGRPVAFMAKQELFTVPVLKQAIQLYGAYPVKRGAADRSALKAAMNSVKTGWATGVFLDGSRSSDGRIQDPKQGAAWLAAQTQAQILPVCLWGSDRILSRGGWPRSVPLTIRIAAPMPPPTSTDRAELDRVTQACATVINQMHDLGR